MTIHQVGLFPNSLKAIAKRSIGLAYKDKPVVADMLYKADPTQDAYEEYIMHAGMNMMQRKTEGGAGSYASMAEFLKVRLRSVEYSLGFKVTRIMMEDGHGFDAAAKGAAELKRAYIRTKETIAADIFNNGFDSAFVQEGGDAKELFATDHTLMVGTGRNELSTAADLSEASLEQAVIDIRAFTDNVGNKIDASARKLIIHPDNMFNADRILKGKERTGTGDRDINALNYNGLLQQVVIWDYLEDADAWFIETSENETGNGLIYMNRRALDLNRDNEGDTQNASFLSTARFAYGWLDWRAYFGSPGA